jgi:hypothetical protein
MTGAGPNLSGRICPASVPDREAQSPARAGCLAFLKKFFRKSPQQFRWMKKIAWVPNDQDGAMSRRRADTSSAGKGQRAARGIPDRPRQPDERSSLGFSGVALAERRRLACAQRLSGGNKTH